jgi:hypothetical protein
MTAAAVSSLGLLLAAAPAVSAQVDIARSESRLLTGPAAPFAPGDIHLAAGDLLAGAPSKASPDGGTSATAPRHITAEEATEPLPRPWNVQPTYTANNGGGSTSYLQLQPILTFDVGLPLAMRFQQESGPVVAGIGDLTWLSVLFLGQSERWGKVGGGPVFVFPTASHEQLGQGKYQVGPALYYVNKAVPGWQFAFLLQQFFSFAGDPARSDINQLKLQPFVTAYLPDSWYITSKPIITLDFKKHTSSVPLDLVFGRVVAGRWNLYLEGTVFPAWTSKPSNNYTITVNIGYVTESPLQRR